MEIKIGHSGCRSPQKSVLNFNMMVRMMVGISVVGLTTRAPAVTPPAQTQRTVQMGQNLKGTLDPSVPPSTAEWGRFMRLGQKNASRLWNDYRHKGFAFGNWHWKWRLGWIRVCREVMAGEPAELSTICPSILDKAFVDRALVVRAEAVSTLGQIHDGSGDAGISKKLLEATTDPRNRRKNTPVMVQRRALYAIKKIGHPEYVKAAAAAAAKDPALNEYWQKLELARSGASKP